jgi:hypothetical protein
MWSVRLTKAARVHALVEQPLSIRLWPTALDQPPRH